MDTLKKNGNKYLILDSANKNKEVLKKFAKLWDKSKNEIVIINGVNQWNVEKIL